MPVDYDNRICACGKEYSNDGQFNRHLKTCKKVQAIKSKAHKQGSRIWAREEKEGWLKTGKDPFSKHAKLTHDYGEGSSMTRQEEGCGSTGPATAGGSKVCIKVFSIWFSIAQDHKCRMLIVLVMGVAHPTCRNQTVTGTRRRLACIPTFMKM